MDLLGSIVSSILVETCRFMCGSLYSHVSSAVQFRSNFDALRKELKKLIDLRNKVNQDLESAENNRWSLQVQLRRWLRDVETVVSEANLMEEDVSPSKKKLYGCSLNCRVSRRLVKILKEVKRLEKLGTSFIDMFSVSNSAEMVERIPGPSIHNQTTASQNLIEIMKHLSDDQAQKIGVWGMGGVGKTTIVRALNNKLWREAAAQPFRIVIWVTVSKEFDLRRVQRQIAERLNLEVRIEETSEGLARRIYHRLEKERNFLLILDDVWKTIDFDLLGVPQVEDHRGSKVIITSRFLEVCQSMRTDVEVKVNCLSEEEAWQLFCQSAGEAALSDRIKPIAKAVSQECGGLPLAIITMGTAMRGKKNAKLWKHVLRELRRSVPCVRGIEDKIYKTLKLSYDSLEGKIKSCFLFCSLFPEDYSIEVSELVRYWVAEGLIYEQHIFEHSMNEGITLIEKLKDSCLLEDGNRDGTVKMHDVVRDFAIWIVSSPEDECNSLVMSGIGLCETSPDKFVGSIRRVSLMNNKLETLPDCMKRCSKSSTLLLQGNFLLKEVPKGFLQGFQELRILNLGGTRIGSLPPFLCQLQDLRSLILRDCYYLRELPSLETLCKLQLLDLCATCIRELPRGVENLTSLRILDLSRTHYLETIRAGTIPQLSCLEVLDMTLSHYHWGVEGQVEKGQATFEEIGCLKRLLALSIRVERIPPLGSGNVSWIKRLKKFQFFIGPTANSLPTRHDKRRVTISSLNLSQEWIGWLLANASSLILNHCWGLSEMLENLTIDSIISFNSLKSLRIESFGSSLRPGGCAAQLDLLPNLEELHLHRVNLEKIRELVGHLGLRFQCLKRLEVSWCPRLKCLLSIGNFICFLPNLEEIRVSFCNELEVLFDYSPWSVSAPAEPVVPSLRVIKLRNLPKLKTICSQNDLGGCLEQVEVIKCNLVRKLPVNSQNANRIKEIRGESHWWNNLSWSDNNAKTVLQPCFRPA